MFGSLEKYKTKKYYAENKIIEFYYLNGQETIKSKYMIFAVFKTSISSPNTFKYYNYINFYDRDEFETFINKVKELSLYETGISAEYGDKLITLSTCEYSQTNGRLVILAKRIN